MNMVPYIRAICILGLGLKEENGVWDGLELRVARTESDGVPAHFRPDVSYGHWMLLRVKVEEVGLGRIDLYYPSKGVGVAFTHFVTQRIYKAEDDFQEPWNISQTCGIWAICMALAKEREISPQMLALRV